MKILRLLGVALLLSACTGGGIKGTLKQYVVERGKPANVKYKLISYEFTDTITVGDEVDSLCEELFLTRVDPDSSEFRKLRNQEFADFHPSDPNYEEEIMHGSLRDASAWVTEVRQVTERADSLLANWDKVTWHSYDYKYLYSWYKARWANFYDPYGELDFTAYTSYIYTVIEESRERFVELEELLTADPNAVYRYNVRHEFSIFNPVLGTRVRLVETVYLNDKLEYVDSDTEDFAMDK